MSWELTSFLILGAVLFVGFAWYERSRPPSQVVALVAALAALAIVGRIAFAAFPNVKPTTDIVIFAGYALGGAPGFAVGALAALVSNFWFGQGPWTPWQMAGWGLCGVLGAALALGGRNANRFLLAAVCGLAALAYGALLNFSLMATSGGELSWRYFGVLEARAIPFEFAHAAGNVVFALVAGPALVRMLARFRDRFDWRRRGDAPGGREAGTGAHRRPGPALRGGGLAAILAASLLGGAVVPAPAEGSSVDRAAAWLEASINADGGFGSSRGDDSGAETTCWAMLGLEATGRNPLDLSSGGRTPVDFLRGKLDALRSPGDLARTILALEGAGVDPRDFGGRDLVAALLANRRDDGSYQGWPNSTAFAVLALRAAGVEGGVQGSLSWLRKVQNDDGGWGDVPGSPSTSDGTGAVLQVLSGGSKPAKQALAYLEKAQRKGGGFPLGGNGAVNTQSTAWAIEGILAVGRDPAAFRRGGSSALEYLAGNQRADGSYRYAEPSGQTPADVADQTPVWVTSEVLVAAAGKHYPVPPAPRAPKPKLPSPAGPKPGGALPSVPVPPSSSEPLPVSPSAPSGGGGGALPGSPPRPGRLPSGAQPAIPSTGGPALEGPAATAPFTPSASTAPEGHSAEASGEGGDSSALGAVVLGLLAGCLLFGAGLAGRRGWMRWRYGL